MKKILEEIVVERIRQEVLWGIQTHPCTVGELPENGQLPLSADEICMEYNIPSEDVAKRKCDSLFKKGVGTYADIAIEELSEVVSEPDPAKRRIELIQLTAVCVAWVESLDRRIESGDAKIIKLKE